MFISVPKYSITFNSVNIVKSVNRVNSVNSVNIVNSVYSVNSYIAVLPPSPMVFFSMDQDFLFLFNGSRFSFILRWPKDRN